MSCGIAVCICRKWGVRNSGDDIFSEPQEGGSLAGDHLTLKLIKNAAATGYRADLTIALTDESFTDRRGGFGGPPPGWE